MEPWTNSILSGISMLLGTDLAVAVPLSAAGGVLLHAALLRPFEVEQFLISLLAILFASTLSLGYSLYLTGFTVIDAFVRTFWVASSFYAGIFTSILIYRVLCHPLHGFPGPFGAKATAFYALAQAAKECRYHTELKRMHGQYGDIVRTGPRELSVVRKSAVSLFFGPTSECTKSTWYAQKEVSHEKSTLHLVRDVKAHRMRRRLWDKALGSKAVRFYQPGIKNVVESCVAKLRENLDPVDGTAWFMLLSFDIMGIIGLGKDFGGIATGIEHPAIEGIHAHMTVLGIMSHAPWLLNLLSRIPGVTAGYRPFFKFCQDEVASKQKSLKTSDTPHDVLSWLIQGVREKDPTAPPTTAALHEDSRLLIVAGSETTATALTCVFFYLAKYPAVQAKLRQQLLAVMPTSSDWDYEKTKSVGYLDDVINETLRLKPALLIGGYREVPQSGIQVDEVLVPGGTNVFVPIQLIQTDPRYWKQPLGFIPERFGERREEMGTDDAPFVAFSLGPYSCIGKGLALTSMRMVISRLLQEFDVGFADGEDGVNFDTKAKDNFTTTLPPIMLRFTERNGKTEDLHEV